MSLHSNDSKREEYHRYLEKSGVIEYFSHVLVDLYETPEKPLDPNEFLREQLSKFFPDDTDDLRQEILHHEEMLNERENTLHELQQQQYLIRQALEEKGIKFEDLNLLLESEDDDDDIDYSSSIQGDGNGDGDDDEEEAKFTFDAQKVPVFKYHQTTDAELAQQQPSDAAGDDADATKSGGDDSTDKDGKEEKEEK